MSSEIEELIPTRATLLSRLKNWQDEASWQDFFRTYEKLIFSFALKSGLTEAEAKDVMQETLVSVARQISGFVYDPAVCSFKTWLLNMVRWRIADQFRKRHHGMMLADELPNTRTINEPVDPAGQQLEAIWDEEWEKNLLATAVSNVKRRIEPEKYQLFDFYVNKGWTPERVAQSFGVTANQVYLAKSRVEKLIKEEIFRIQTEMA